MNASERLAELNTERINSLIGSIASGSGDAVAQLYTMLYGRLFHAALAIVCQREAAQEAVHEAFICLIEKASYFRRAENGYGFVVTIVKRKALNILKREKLRRGVSLDSVQLQEQTQRLNDEQIDVKAALGSLAEDERRVLYLKYYADFTVRKIAALLKLSKSSVQRTVDRAEGKLKKILQGGDGR